MSGASLMSDVVGALVLALLYVILHFCCEKIRKVRGRPTSGFFPILALVILTIIFIIVAFIPRAAFFFSLVPAGRYSPTVPFMNIFSLLVIYFGFKSCYGALRYVSGEEIEEGREREKQQRIQSGNQYPWEK